MFLPVFGLFAAKRRRMSKTGCKISVFVVKRGKKAAGFIKTAINRLYKPCLRFTA